MGVNGDESVVFRARDLSLTVNTIVKETDKKVPERNVDPMQHPVTRYTTEKRRSMPGKFFVAKKPSSRWNSRFKIERPSNMRWS